MAHDSHPLPARVCCANVWNDKVCDEIARKETRGIMPRVVRCSETTMVLKVMFPFSVARRGPRLAPFLLRGLPRAVVVAGT
jgi:hypothetical protein